VTREAPALHRIRAAAGRPRPEHAALRLDLRQAAVRDANNPIGKRSGTNRVDFTRTMLDGGERLPSGRKTARSHGHGGARACDCKGSGACFE